MTAVSKSSRLPNEGYLIQRLEKPWHTAVTPFSFGGGLLNGGLGKEAIKLLTGIFTFDYMGSAEFEFGAVPKALQAVLEAAKREELTAFSFKLTETQVRKVSTWGRNPRDLPLVADPTVYVLCRKDWQGAIQSAITEMARGRGRYKEATKLEYVLRPNPESSDRTAGWLELDNGYFFFTDWEMFEKTASLFGLEVKEAALKNASRQSGKE